MRTVNRYYVWKAVCDDGSVLRGKWKWADLEGLKGLLREKGYYLIWVRKRYRLNKPGFRKERYLFWIDWTKKLAMTLNAGIPIQQALEMLAEHETEKGKKEQWQKLIEDMKGGRELADSMETLFPSPPSFVQTMVKAGQKAGCLNENLHKSSQRLTEDYRLYKNIKEGLAYPVLLIFMTAIAFFLLSLGVLPRYEALYRTFGTELPVLTRAIFVSGKILPQVGVVGAVIFLILIIRFRIRHREKWQEEWERAKRHWPILGEIYRQQDVIECSALLSRFLNAGIPLLEGLNFTRQNAVNPDIKELLDHGLSEVRGGGRLSIALRTKPGYFSSFRCDLLAVGENTGEMESILEHIAQSGEKELQEKLHYLTRMMEPFLILGTAVLIGLLAVGVLTPMFDLTTYL